MKRKSGIPVSRGKRVDKNMSQARIFWNGVAAVISLALSALTSGLIVEARIASQNPIAQGTTTPSTLQVGQLGTVQGSRPSQQTIQQTGAVGTPSVPGAAKISPAPATLSLADAIDLALQNNLATLLARERKREARGFEKESLAGLLPNVSAATYQANLTLNLAALGLQPGTFPGINSPFVGPFNNFDARARLQQTIFSLSAIRTYQAGRAGVHVAEMQERYLSSPGISILPASRRAST